jgi:hypothetical protein
MSKVITGEVRFSYANVFVPKLEDGQEVAKYGVALLIPKTDTKTVAAIEAAIKNALEQGRETKFGGKIPKAFKNPLRDGDEEKPDEEIYQGMYFLNAKTKDQPQIVGLDRKPIIDEEQFYSGCYGHASITFYPFKVPTNSGVAVALNSLMKSKDGEPLGSRKASAEEDFSNLEIENFD